MQKKSALSAATRIYLDNNATTPYSPILKSRWAELLDIFGNPSSIHQDSRASKAVLREARHKLANLLECSPLEIIFNSGASEGNCSVLNAVFEVTNKYRNEFLISAVEHPSVLKAAVYLQSRGALVHYIPVNRDGVIDLNYIKEKLSVRTALVSVMYANNETGTLFPIKEISKLAHKAGALMHADCVQTLGKLNLNIKDLDLDYATFSAHKFYALKGTGFCYVKKSAPWLALIHGGGQERNRRGGTENIIGIAAINIVLDQLINTEVRTTEMLRLRNLLEELIDQDISNVKFIARNAARINNTSCLIINDVDGETLLMSLDLKGYSVSTGAACSSGNPEPSPVLLAMGLSRTEAQSSLRVSLGWETTEDQIVKFVSVLKNIIIKLREINRDVNILEKKIDHEQ